MGRQMLTPTITEDVDYQQQSAVPLTQGTNGADDVPIYAVGPMAHLIHKVHQQSYIGHVIRYASCIGGMSAHCDRASSSESSYSMEQQIINRRQYSGVETRDSDDAAASIDAQSV